MGGFADSFVGCDVDYPPDSTFTVFGEDGANAGGVSEVAVVRVYFGAFELRRGWGGSAGGEL